MYDIILSDVHANYTALDAVVREAEQLTGVKDIYFLGDLLGYGPAEQAVSCVEWLQRESHTREENDGGTLYWLPGNHDEWAIHRLGRIRPEASVTLLRQRALLEQTIPEDWSWFAGEVSAALDNELRSLLTRTYGAGPDGLFVAFTHAAIGRNERRGTYLYPWQHAILRSQLDPLRKMTDAGTKILFCGHTHVPFVAQILPDHSIVFHSIKYGKPIRLDRGEYIINPGSVGHPRDGDPRAAFVLFEPHQRTVEFYRVEYDIQSVVNELKMELYSSSDNDAVHYLMRMDGIRDVDVTRRVQVRYEQRVEKAYDNLMREIATGYGGAKSQFFQARVYRVFPWGLEALDK